MLETIIFAFIGMLVLVGGMAIGVMFGRKPISGSCGGLGALGIDAECEICGGNPARCESARDGVPAYDPQQAKRLSDNAEESGDRPRSRRTF